MVCFCVHKDSENVCPGLLFKLRTLVHLKNNVNREDNPKWEKIHFSNKGLTFKTDKDVLKIEKHLNEI